MARSMYVPEGQPVTAFNGDEKGVALMDTHEGLAQKNSRMWQIIALVSLSAFFLALGVNIWAVNLPKTVPVIVSVNGDGRADYIGKVDKASYNTSQIPDIHKYYQIRTLIESMFTWYTDAEAQQKAVETAERIVQQGAVQQLDQFFTRNNPFQNMGKLISVVDIEPPMKQTENTFITYFDVTLKTTGGTEAQKTRYSILTTIGYFSMSVENPLGVYVTNFDVREISRK